jgi:hypothetical protein
MFSSSSSGTESFLFLVYLVRSKVLTIKSSEKSLETSSFYPPPFGTTLHMIFGLYFGSIVRFLNSLTFSLYRLILSWIFEDDKVYLEFFSLCLKLLASGEGK